MGDPVPTRRPTPVPTDYPTRNLQPTVHKFLCPTLESSKICSGHGTCNSENGKCLCDRGYTNDYCSEPMTCKVLDCGHGACDDSDGIPVCQCESGYDGNDCSHKTTKTHDDASDSNPDTNTNPDDTSSDEDNAGGLGWTQVLMWIAVAAALLLIAGGVVWGYKKFRPGAMKDCSSSMTWGWR